MKNSFTLKCGKRELDITSPQVMAVLNVTPDSFSDGGSYYKNNKLNLNVALETVQKFIVEGASIIDVGGESTRPGAKPVGEQEELDRVLPVIEAIVAECNVIVSVDTSTPSVMVGSAKLGAGLINDIRALTKNGALEAAAKTQLPVCLMHMQGTPKTMQKKPIYMNAVSEVKDFFIERAAACKAVGISHENIVLDPGFGFGKTLEHNLALLRELAVLSDLSYPILVGLSRKSLLGELLGRDVNERLAGSLALVMGAVTRGANIVRVHDVAATRDVITVYNALNNEHLTA